MPNCHKSFSETDRRRRYIIADKKERDEEIRLDTFTEAPGSSVCNSYRACHYTFPTITLSVYGAQETK